ncbi:MAG: hypothetical protein JSV04_15535 [Candidatus Heimdallarchaeota archaeon]|nr:MAG: hypothetical protein JSV04_15535 [Candidatus Heimdallarchaeota archaeon]
MDILNHTITIIAAIMLMGLYSKRRGIWLLVFLFIFEFFSFWLVTTKVLEPLSSLLGYLLLCGLTFAAVWERSCVDTVEEQVNYEKIIMIFFASFVAANSHPVDFIIVLLGTTTFDALEENRDNMWRPHNLWHTPLFSLIAAIVISVVLFYGMEILANRTKNERIRFRTPLLSLILVSWTGYLIHILGDTLTYDFDIFYFWPFHDFGASFYDFANNGFIVSCPPANPDCFIYYWAMPIFAWAALILAILIKIGSNPSYRSIFKK